MIILKNVCKKYNEHTVIDNLNLTINDGEFIILTGESGCGKTTLLNMIGAVEPVTSGEILVDNVDILKKKNQLEYYKNKVGFLFQNFALVDNKTVEENLNLIKKDARSSISIEDALKFVGLSGKSNQKIYKLSGGEQQRVALARLLIKKCEIVLADEPTGSLDKKNAAVVMKLLNEINKNGKTVIMVTHDMEIASAYGKQISLNANNSLA